MGDDGDYPGVLSLKSGLGGHCIGILTLPDPSCVTSALSLHLSDP